MAAVRWRNSVRSFAIASRMKALEMVVKSASKLRTVIHTLPNTASLAEPGSNATIGVRNKNSAP